MTLLEIRDLSKSFGGLQAVNGVSFDTGAGSITGLIGPNGAGKTTIFNLITGNFPADAGTVSLDGTSLLGKPTHRIVSLGVARTFQTIRLFQNLSVLENVLAGCHCRMRSGLLGGILRLPSGRREEKEAVACALGELEFVGLRACADMPAKNLSHGNQRLLEIARATASRPRLVILDEPAGGMNEQETSALIGLIRAIQHRNITVLLIEHDMNLVMRSCERIVVLDNGRVIAEGPPEEVKADRNVIQAYLGAEED